ncbi:hypothetical protein [Altererythrobacter fulvus]|uniref:hypothetical protein n=1 Tax=Caenibius fulvus TaxID=2126012 RepID=UPI0030171CE7
MRDNFNYLDGFPHFRVLFRAAATFIALLAGAQVLAGFWKPAEDARAWLFSELWATPGLFCAFYALFLTSECIQRSQREAMEKLRSNPIRNRRPGEPPKSRRDRPRGKR